MKKALFFAGGWSGHEPFEACEAVSTALKGEGFEVEVTDDLDQLLDEEKISGLSLIVMCITMGEITGDQMKALSAAVEGGIGFAGWHGGMCDTFRSNTEYQFMTGGQFVAHPGNEGMTYQVTVRDPFHPIMEGIESFEYSSEQYYMHVDPAINVLATTVFDGSIRKETEGVQMPVVWTKFWGEGRVFFSALGHVAKEFEVAVMLKLVMNGFKWAAK